MLYFEEREQKIMMWARFILLSDKGRQPLTKKILVQSVADYVAHKEAYQQEAIIKICAFHRWTIKHLKGYGYNQIKVQFEEKEG